MRNKTILKRDFYLQDTRAVAKQLIGKLLIREVDGERLSGVIVETEAYRGFDDTASHAHKGPTERCKVMFGDAGYAYVYLTYGIHHMLNFVTEERYFPSAVLVRAIEPVEGVDLIRKLRNVEKDVDLTSGPAKVTKALNIDRTLNGIDITKGKDIWVEEPEKGLVNWLGGYSIVSTPRIGIQYADEQSRNKKWRFLVDHNLFVSR